MQYLVLGLGDTNYDQFCFCGKYIDKRLKALGANRLVDITCADEAVNLTETVEAWKFMMWETVSSTQVSSTQVSPTQVTSTQVASPMKDPKSPMLILYGSETGNAEAIARQLQDMVLSHGLESNIASLNEYEKVGWLAFRYIVFLTSTTGNGDAPRNAEKFMRYIRKRTHAEDMLEHLEYSLLALGDTNYDKFCNTGKLLNKRLGQLGAKQFNESVYADEAVGISEVVEAWKYSIFGCLSSTVSLGTTTCTVVQPKEPIAHFNDICPHKTIESLVAQTRRPATLNTCLVVARNIDERPVVQNIRNRSQSASMHSFESANPSVVGTSSSVPMHARVISGSVLTSPLSERKVLHLELGLVHQNGPEVLPQWQPGDAIGVICPNPDHLVSGLLGRLGLKGSSLVNVVVSSQQSSAMSVNKAFVQERLVFQNMDDICSIEEIFTWGVDVTSIPRKTFLRMLAEYCSDELHHQQLLYLSSIGGKETFSVMFELQKPNLLEILTMFPSCNPPLEVLLFGLPQLAPRFYSIANSPLGPEGCSRIAIAFTVIDNLIELPLLHGKLIRRQRGICTSWLESLANHLDSSDSIKVFIRNSSAFHMPGNFESPIIMVGPGTGVAPFIGFIEHRKYLKGLQESADNDLYAGNWRGVREISSGDFDGLTLERKEYPVSKFAEMSLYYGCRQKDVDFLFKDFLLREEKSKQVTLRCAFSRERGQEKTYVQRLMELDGESIAKCLIEKNGYLFVCGDGVKMAKEVHQTLQEIIIQHGHMTQIQTTQFLTEIAKRGRYTRDIWS